VNLVIIKHLQLLFFLSAYCRMPWDSGEEVEAAIPPPAENDGARANFHLLGRKLITIALEGIMGVSNST